MISLANWMLEAAALDVPAAASFVTTPPFTSTTMPSFRSSRTWAAPSSSVTLAFVSSKRTRLTITEPKPEMRPAENVVAVPPVPPVPTVPGVSPPPPQATASRAAASMPLMRLQRRRASDLDVAMVSSS